MNREEEIVEELETLHKATAIKVFKEPGLLPVPEPPKVGGIVVNGEVQAFIDFWYSASQSLLRAIFGPEEIKYEDQWIIKVRKNLKLNQLAIRIWKIRKISEGGIEEW